MPLTNLFNKYAVENFLKKQPEPDQARIALEAFYENTPSVQGIRVNDEFLIIDRSVLGFHILHTSDIAWVYPKRLNMKLYGVIPTGGFNSMVFRTRSGQEHPAVVATKGASEELYKYLYTRIPGAVFGYSEELARVWNESIKGGHETWDKLARAQHMMRSTV
ncbi:MAG: hypothetical protein IJC48_00920 [Clostridia bacterium]|nr:hypothetical protein [Clostridia bacterium]